MSDHTADSFDHASVVEQNFRDAAVKAAGWVEPTPKDFDGETCYDCGSDIPEGRLALGKFRCIGCQAAREKRYKLGGR